MKSKSRKGNLLGRWAFWLGLAMLVAVGGFSYASLQHKGSDAGTGKAIFTAQKGPLTISVTEKGTIQAREQLILKNEVEGNTTILYLVPEGTRVKQGDLLVELDSSRQQDELLDQQIRVQNAEASYITSRENLEVTKNQAKADIDKAQLEFDFAVQDRLKFVEGEFPKMVMEADNRITITTEELRRAREKVDWSQKLAANSYISQSELDSDKLALTRAELNLKLAQEELKLLQQYTYKRTLAQLDSDVSQNEMALERIKLRAAANIVQAEADLQAKKSEFERQQARMTKIEQQIAKAKIFAPMAGLVVYATSAQSGGFRGNQEPLAEGQSLRERQELIYLPTTDSFMAAVKVHETSLEKIRLGLPVRITVDALPGRTYTGRVATIAPLPDAMSIFMNPDLKVYNTQIHIEGSGQDLRNGMSCAAEIIVDHIDNAISVPVQSVLRIGGRPHVYVVDASDEQPRPVELGQDNNSLAHIRDGLKEGERVLLNPPLAAAHANSEPAQEVSSEMRKMISESPAATPAADPAAGETMNIPGIGAIPMRDGRPDLAALTPEQQQQMRQRLANMSSEERAQLMQRFGGGGRERGEGGPPPEGATGEGAERPRREGGPHPEGATGEGGERRPRRPEGAPRGEGGERRPHGEGAGPGMGGTRAPDGGEG